MNRRSGPFDVVLFKRKRTGYLMLGAIAAVLVIIVIVIDHSRTTHTTANSGQSTEALTPLVPRQLLGGIAAVPFTTNGAAVALPSALVPLERIKPAGSSQVAPALETGDKALIVANLGEFSPLCAIDRWALLAALSHFGTFSGVREMSSSPVEPPADIATFTFRTMTFASPYVALQAVETFDRSRDVLQSPSSEDAKVFSHFDEPPYVKAVGGLPFVDLGGEYLQPGTFPWLDAMDLKGLTRSKILSQMSSKTSGGALIDIQAAYFTAAICAIDGERPHAVCSTTGIQVLEDQLGSEPLTK